MNPTIMAIIMLVIVVAAIIWNKVPMNFVMFVVPVICALFLGYSITEISDAITTQLATTMKSAGYMLLFGLIYFTMLTETGMFDTIVGAVMKLIGKNMNVVIVMVMTVVIGALGYLTANMSTTYLICFPIMIPLYKKFKLDQSYAFLLCQTAISAMCFLPWGIGIANSAMMAGVDTTELAAASIPWGACFIPVIILMIVYFTIMHKKEVGTLGVPQGAAVETTSSEAKEETKENPNARPKLFWVNLLIFVIAIVALAVFQITSYIVFIFASVATALINYPKNFGEIWNKAGRTYYNVLIMLIAISVYLAIFNMSPEDGSKLSMVEALANAMVGIFPEFLTRYLYIIFLLLEVIIIRFVPYQVFNAMYPLFISIGASYGISAIAIIAPFVCNLALATSVTPMNSATYIGCTLCEVDVDKFVKKGVPIMTVANALVVVIAVIFGVLKL